MLIEKTGDCYIYKIVQNDNGEVCYIGRTSQIRSRELGHRRECDNIGGKQYYKYLYCHIREHGSWSNFTFTQIDFKEGLSMLEKQKLEQYWIDELKPILNQVRAYRSPEYHESQRDERLRRNKQYYQEKKYWLSL